MPLHMMTEALRRIVTVAPRSKIPRSKVPLSKVPRSKA